LLLIHYSFSYFSAPSGDGGKISTAEHAETAEHFLGKNKKHKSFYGYGPLFAFRSSGERDKRMNEEGAKSAEIVPGKPLGRFDLPGRVKKSAAFPAASWP
jgi:hypothetical protein